MPTTMAGGYGGRGGLRLGFGLGSGFIGGQSPAGPTKLRPVAFTSGVPNEFGGLGSTNKQVGSTYHFIMMEALPDGSFQVDYPNWGASAGQGEWTMGGGAQGELSLIWIDATKTQRVSRLLGRSGNARVTCLDGENLTFFGPDVTNALPGSSAWLTFWGQFDAGGYYSHAKADYANGDGLVYGASVPNLTGGTTLYGNTYSGAGDAYPPIFIGGNATRTTIYNDDDSREAGVLVSGVIADPPNTLYGSHGQTNRLLTPYMAVVDLSIPGATAAEMADPTKTVRRDAIGKRSDIRATGIGVNDIEFNGASAASVIVNENTRSARIGKPTNYKTIDPVTVSNANNTALNATYDLQRQSLNTTRRATAHVFDIASKLESGVSVGTWASTTYNVDGTHESTLGNQTGIAALGYDVVANYPGVSLVNAGYQYPTGANYQSLTFASGWTAQQASLSTLQLYSPEHKITSALIVEDTATNNHDVFGQPSLVIASTTKVFTHFAKRVTGARNLFLQIMRTDNFTDGRVVVDLGTGGIIYQAGATGITVNSATVTAYEDYWQVALSLAFAAGVPANPFQFVKMADASGNDTYAGNGTSSIAIWGYNISTPAVVSGTAWDPASKTATVNLSNNNLTATSTGSSSLRPDVFTTVGASTGKKFFSIVTTGTQTVNQGVCLVMSTFVLGTDNPSGAKGISASGDGNFYGNSASKGGGLGTWVTNDVIDIAVDLGAKLFWARRNGGNWNNSGTANPATGVGGVDISYMTGTIYPLDEPWPNTTHTANFGATAYTYAAPAGFSNW